MQRNSHSQDDINAIHLEFIALANQLKNTGYDTKTISAALMAASSTYCTYTAAGNEGYLEPSGVDKVVTLYREILISIQNTKKAALNPQTK